MRMPGPNHKNVSSVVYTHLMLYYSSTGGSVNSPVKITWTTWNITNYLKYIFNKMTSKYFLDQEICLNTKYIFHKLYLEKILFQITNMYALMVLMVWWFLTLYCSVKKKKEDLLWVSFHSMHIKSQLFPLKAMETIPTAISVIQLPSKSHSYMVLPVKWRTRFSNWKRNWKGNVSAAEHSQLNIYQVFVI